VENSKLLPAVMMKDPASTKLLEVRETACVSAGKILYPAQRPARKWKVKRVNSFRLKQTSDVGDDN